MGSIEQEPSTSENQCSSQLRHEWIEIQESLKERLITEDEFFWKLPLTKALDFEGNRNQNLVPNNDQILKYVGGVDLSYSKNDPSIACATLVVLDLSTLQVVHEDSSIVKLDIPYVPGFLAFREVPVLLELLKKMKKRALPSYPQVLMVDGNGLLHPRGFGLACHLGVLANLPTIGVGKNLHHVDGLTQSKVRQLFDAKENASEDVSTLIGDSGSTLGADKDPMLLRKGFSIFIRYETEQLVNRVQAMRSTPGSLKPIFISVGHCISLATAIKIVRFCCRYRVPEPTRQADIRSKECLRNHGLS